MANQGAKKRKEGNKKHMQNLLRLIIACNVIYVLIRMLFFYSTFTSKHWVGLLVTSAAYGISYQQLSSMAKPTYTHDGELLDGGFDMTTDGICGVAFNDVMSVATRSIYLHDVIYITSFVQVTSIISGKFWWTYSVIPAFAAYKFFGLLRGVLSFGSEGGVEDEKTRKKREKMEKKASRGKILRPRTR